MTLTNDGGITPDRLGDEDLTLTNDGGIAPDQLGDADLAQKNGVGIAPDRLGDEDLAYKNDCMKFDARKLVYNSDGLIPAVIRERRTGNVLTLAYMNEESLRISLREGYTCFFSRSRRKLWRKGETSGNRQRITSVTADCDYDALLVEVEAEGPACHTGEESCFHNALYERASGGCDDLMKYESGADLGESAAAANGSESAAAGNFNMQTLYDIVMKRRAERPAGSYTTYLFDKGREKILKKVGEECAEVIIAAMKRDEGEIIYETADLCYHMLVLLCDAGIEPSAIIDELSRRRKADESNDGAAAADGALI